MSEDGLITIASGYSVKDTLGRLEIDLRARNITVFVRIDHAEGAAASVVALATVLASLARAAAE